MHKLIGSIGREHHIWIGIFSITGFSMNSHKMGQYGGPQNEQQHPVSAPMQPNKRHKMTTHKNKV
jgi:hypothetical protein